MRHALVMTVLAFGFLWSCTSGQRSMPVVSSQEGDVVFLLADADATPADVPPEASVDGDDQSVDGPAATGREVIAASVMQVNGIFITVDDVLLRRRAELRALPATLDEMSFRHQAQLMVRDGVRELVQQALLYETANNRLSDEEKDQLTAELKQARQDMINRTGGSIGRLHDQLAAEGLTLDGVLAEHRKKLVIELYIRWKMQPSLYVSRKMMWDHYEANASEFSTPRHVAMQMIVIDPRALAAASGDVSDEGLAKARATAATRIQAAQVRLRAGASFEDVARMYSTDVRAADGGLWPLMRQGSHRLSKVEDAAFGLELEQLSEIIEDSGCFALVRPAEIKPGHTIPFETAQRTIEATLRDEQYRVLQDKHFQSLLKTAYIHQTDDFLDRCVQSAMEKHWRRP